MSSLYLRENTCWAKSYERGKMLRWSLGTSDKRESRGWPRQDWHKIGHISTAGSRVELATY